MMALFNPPMPIRRLLPAPVLWACSLAFLFAWSLASAGADPAPKVDKMVDKWQTAKGAQVVFHAPASSPPIIDIHITFTAGKSIEGGRGGLARLTLSGLVENNGRGLFRTLEDEGSRLDTSLSQDAATLQLRTLSSGGHLERSARALGAVLAQPQYQAEDLERVREQLLVELREQGEDAYSLASRELRRVLFSGHPYGSIADEASVSSLTLSEVESLHQRYYVAANAIITIVGDLDRERAQRAAGLLTEKLDRGRPAPRTPAAPPIRPGLRVKETVADELAVVLLAAPLPQAASEDRHALRIANQMLGGGGFASILMEQLRTKRGLVYGAFSAVRVELGGGFVALLAGTQPDKTAEVEQLLRQLATDFTAKEFDAQAFDLAKIKLKTSALLARSSNSGLTNALARLAFYQRPESDLWDYAGLIDRIDRKNAILAWQRHIDPSRLAAIVVRPDTKAR